MRLVLWLQSAGYAPQIWDEKDYDNLAHNLVWHSEFSYDPGRPVSLRPPLYPFVVAGLYEVSGLENYQAVRAFQALLSLATMALVYLLGRESFSCGVGWWAAAFYGFYPSLLGYNNLILTEVLFTFFLVAACLALTRALARDSLAALAAAGALLGLATLTRSVLWLFPAVLGLFLLWAWRGTLARRLLACVALALPFALILTPWAVRNTRLERTLVVVDCMGGRNLMMGNYEYTPLYRSWDAISLKGEQAWYNVLKDADPEARDVTQGQLDKRALRYGLRFAAAHLELTALRGLVKFFDFWGLERELIAGAGQGVVGLRGLAALLILAALILGCYVLALFAGIFGMVLAPPPDRRLHLLFLLVMAYVCGMHTLVFGHSRYHLPLMPLVLLYAASLVVHAPDPAGSRHGAGFWLAAAACAFLAAGWAWSSLTVDLAMGTIIH